MKKMPTTIARRHGIALLVLTAGALATSAAIAAETQPHVIVEAERSTTEVVGRTGTGVPIVLVELRGRVDYSDLDLSIDSNAKVFKQRVHDAARRLCADLDQLYPVTDSARNCASQAEHGAMSQVDAAIAAARERKAKMR